MDLKKYRYKGLQTSLYDMYDRRLKGVRLCVFSRTSSSRFYESQNTQTFKTQNFSKKYLTSAHFFEEKTTN